MLTRFSLLIFLTLCLSLLACANQDEYLIAACKQELDQAYLRVGKPSTRDFDTLVKIQKESENEILKLISGQNGVSISSNVLNDHILLSIARDGEVSSRVEWRPPE